jgi:hypothetical protein
MLEGYVVEYAEQDKEYEVISSEQTFQLRDPPPARVHLLHRRHLRRAVESSLRRSRIKFKEFKTAAAIKTDGLPMDEQASTYWTYGPKWLQAEASPAWRDAS